MKENEFGDQDLPSYTTRSSNLSRFFLILVIVLLLVAGVLAGLFFIGFSKRDTTSAVVPTPAITEMITPLPTSSVSAMLNAGANPSSSTGELSTVDRATKLDRSALTIVVLNGSGEAGAAGGVSTYLKDLGYKIARVGNADVFTYKNLTVMVKKSKSDYMNLIKRDLQANSSFASVSASVDDSIAADAEVIVGE